jgi:adenylate cyclase
MAVLIKRGEGGIIETIPLRRGKFSLGRSPDNDLILTDKAASREHARIEEIDDKHVLIDLGSSNGTFLNNKRVKGEVALKDGDRVRIGETEFTYASEMRGAQFATDSDEIYATQIVKPVSAVKSMTTQDFSSIRKFPTARLSQNFFILFQLGRLLNSARNLSELLDTALTLIFKVLKAERGTVLLLDEDNTTLIPRITKTRVESPCSQAGITVSKTIAQKALRDKVSIMSADAKADPRFSYGESIAFQNIRSVLCVPLWDEEEEVRGIIYIDNLHEPNTFSENDLDLLTAVANQVAVAIKKEQMNQQLRREAIVRSSLEKYNSREVVNMIISQIEKGGTAALDMHETEATVLFADLVSFTPLCETLSPSEIGIRLSEYFDRMSTIIFSHSGMINKYVGDAILAIFGAVGKGPGAEEAVAAAVDMVKNLKALREKDKRFTQFSVRIGVNTGLVVLGNIGSLERIEYTALGDAVNVAARLQSIAQPDTVVIGDGTYKHVKEKFPTKQLGETALKGKTTKTRIYEIQI